MDVSATIMDWFIHIVMILSTISLVDSKGGMNAIILGIMMNTIYVGHYLDTEERAQYGFLVEIVSQFSQAIANPSLAFFMAAINSYFSMSRMKISIAAFILLHYRTTIALLLVQYTGLRISWLVLELLQQSTVVLEAQLIFAAVSGLLKAIIVYQHWEQGQRTTSRSLVHDG